MDITSLVVHCSREGGLTLCYEPCLLEAVKSGICTIGPLRLLRCCAELGDDPTAIERALHAITCMGDTIRRDNEKLRRYAHLPLCYWAGSYCS